MCTIILAWQVFADVPVVVAANRDELLTRPSDPPRRLLEDPALWGGRDRLAGGTWLAVDPAGRLAAVTNRHPGGRLVPRDPARGSRGRLPIAVLTGAGDADARLVLEQLSPAACNPVNVVYLSATGALWAAVDDAAGHQLRDLAPGVHVLTEQDPDDPASPKATALLDLATASAASSNDPAELLRRWRALLASHDRLGDGPESAPCIHAERFGTVSSATVVVSGGRVRFEHAEGPPCVTAYQPVPTPG